VENREKLIYFVEIYKYLTKQPNQDIKMTQHMKTTEFYADIMSDVGVGGKTFSTTTAKVADSTAFFANKRANTKDQVVGVGSNMAFETVGARSRGVRAWERARYEVNQRRAKDAEFHRQRKAAIVASTTHKKFPATHLPPVPAPQVAPAPAPAPKELKVIDMTVVDAWDD
jgi:hypothetical protein